MKMVHWGILGAATIAVEKVIPAMQKGQFTQVSAIASRSPLKAEKVAKNFNIPVACDSYEELLDCPDITAIYIPLPNSLHVEWAIKALHAGKHVLCEKPISLTAAGARALIQEADQFPDLKIMEAFMYRFHPQWHEIKTIIRAGLIGQLIAINSHFTFFDDNPNSIVNKKDLGGGSLLDIGCYGISLSRYLFGTEPKKVSGKLVYDPRYEVDYQSSAMLEFEDSQCALFHCGIQESEYQNVTVIGSDGIIEMNRPFIIDPDQKAEVKIQTKSGIKALHFGPCDQYTYQLDLFSKCIIENGPVPTPLEDALRNMIVLDKIIESSKSGSHLNV